MKAYIAAPLFNDPELRRNRELNTLLKKQSIATYLPQEDGQIAFDAIKNGGNKTKVRNQIFQNDIAELKKCDFIIAILDGRSVDEGVCVEIGFAYALNKPIIGLKTDRRSFDKYGDNLMIEGCLKAITNSTTELLKVITELGI